MTVEKQEQCIISLIFKQRTGLYSYAVECGTRQCFENTLKLLKARNVEVVFESCITKSELDAEGFSFVDKQKEILETLFISTCFINGIIRNSQKKGLPANIIALRRKIEVIGENSQETKYGYVG